MLPSPRPSIAFLHSLCLFVVLVCFAAEAVAAVRISEIMAAGQTVLADEDGDYPDWIELHNTGPMDVDLTGCYLTDRADDLTRWRFPEVALRAGGYLIVFASGKDRSAPGGNLHTNFRLASEGGYLALVEADGLTVADAVDFRGQESGCSLGRLGDGAPFWVSQIPTPGAANRGPVPDLVISEFMYHPAPTVANPGDDTADEYIEIFNPTGQAIRLANEVGPWRLDGAVRFDFPLDAVLPPGGRLLVVPFDPADGAAKSAFCDAYGLPGLVPGLCGPFQGHLSNKGERIALERPRPADHAGDPVSWVIVDEVIYFDRDPFAGDADGLGDALERLSASLAGNDPANWRAAQPTPLAASNAAAGWPLFE